MVVIFLVNIAQTTELDMLVEYVNHINKVILTIHFDNLPLSI
jgi:hypothetical protein